MHTTDIGVEGLVSLPGEAVPSVTQEETRNIVFRGERGPLPAHFGTIIINQPEKGVGV